MEGYPTLRGPRGLAEAFGDPYSPVLRKSPRLSPGDGCPLGLAQPRAGSAGGRGLVRPRGVVPCLPPAPPAKRWSPLPGRGVMSTT